MKYSIHLMKKHMWDFFCLTRDIKKKVADLKRKISNQSKITIANSGFAGFGII
jgi:hypothetical protein